SDLSSYAKTDATNITGESLTKWQSALGNGTIVENNKGLVTGGIVHAALKGKADKNADNIEVLAWKKKLGLVDAQATQDSTTNISTQITNISNDITNLKGGFIVSDGTNSKEITLGGTTKDTLTFASADKNLTATFNETNKTISYGVNVANLIGDINKSDTKITNVDLTNNQTITNLKTEIQNITGGSGTTGSLSTKADKNAENIEVLAWQKKLGLADNSATVTPGSTTTTNLFTTVNQLKAGYTVKAGTETFDMKLGDTTAPTIEFAGDSTNGLDVAADKAGKKITYAINKDKLVKYIAGDLIKQMNGEGTGDPSGHGTGEQGQTTPLPVLTNVSTGFNIAVGTDSKNFTFGKGKETNKLTFAGTNDETVISLTGEDGKPTVTVGLADTFKTKVNNKADKSELTELETKVTNITNGTTNIDGSKINLTTNNTFTTLQNTVNGKANTNATNLIKDEDILAWQKKLGLADNSATVQPGSTATTTNLFTTVNQLKAGYTVKAGTETFDMKLGDTAAPTIEFAGDSTNGLDVAADKAGKKITYAINKDKLVKYIAGDLIKQMNGEGTGDPSGHGTGEQGQTTPLPVLTNVSTGFNIAVGTDSKNFTFGKGKETNKLTFAGTNDETVISLTGEDGKPTVTVGLADTFKTKVNNKADKSELTELETKVTNITNGTTNIDGSKINLTTNNTFTTLQNTVNGKADKSDLDAYAKKDAANITGESLTKWQSALGNGTIAENDKGLVTGGTVHTALKGKADTNAGNIEVLAWKKKLGLIDAQATQDSTTNISTQITNINSDITNLKGGFIVSDGKKSKEIILGGTTKDKLTFASADSNLTATFNDTTKTISYGVNVANLIGDINKSGTKITNVDWNKFEGINFYSGGTSNGTTYTPSAKVEDKWQSSRIVFGKGLKAEELKDANNNKYTKISVIGGGQGGKSAYEIWRDHKESDNSQPNKGKSEEDFMNYMKGKDCSADIQHIADNVTKGLSSMDGRINRVSAGAAALSALRPISNAYDPDNKLDFSVGFGYYKGENAVAIGAYYRPDSNTIISLGGAFNGDDNLLNAGLSFKLGKTTPKENRQTQLQQEVDALKEKNGVMEKTIQEQNEKIKELEVLVRSVIHK
ncbi:YadA C-terminal domain-containing protein, partial [Dialister micraerophilus]|uniref:YadA C-terminal domain-containing protein n=1 Tax=Dialister micraerophilus TaxID=309120 RepID=UPI0023F54ADD